MMHSVQSVIARTPRERSAVVFEGSVDLRTARSRETREMVVDTAITLALERGGSSAVTVDEIAERAGISRRTFFNYFGCKEDAFVPSPPNIAPDVAEGFVTDTGSSWYDALLELMVTHTCEYAAIPHRPEKAHELYTLDPMLVAVVLKHLEAFNQQLAEVIARRADRLDETIDAPLVAAVCTTVMRSAMDRWFTDEGCEPARAAGLCDPEKVAEHVDGRFQALRELLA